MSAKVLELEMSLRGTAGRLARADCARLGEALQARGEVGSVADGRVVHAQVVADLANHDHAGVQPHAQAHLAQRLSVAFGILHPLQDGGRRQQGPPRMVLLRNRRPEKRHESVAKELVDGALVMVHLRER